MYRYTERFKLTCVALVVGTLLLALAPRASAAPRAYVSNDATSGTVSVIDTGSNTVSATIPVGSKPTSVAVSPDGSSVYVGDSRDLNNCVCGAIVSVIDTATGSVSNLGFAANPSYPHGVAVGPEGSELYVTQGGSGAARQTLEIFDVLTRAGSTVDVGSSPTGVAVSPSGNRAYVANDYINGTVKVVDTKNLKVIATIPVGSYPQGVAVSPDGTRVYVTNYQVKGTVSVIDAATDTVVATVPVSTRPVGVAVSPDGSQVYVANTCAGCSAINGSVSVIDATTDAVAATVPVGGVPTGIAVTPDGSRVYVTDSLYNTVPVIDTATDTVTDTIGVGVSPNAIGNFIGPGALIAFDSNVSANAGTQVSGTVSALTNNTSCATTDAVIQNPHRGALTFDTNTGSYTYTPNSSTFSGPDAFTWRGQAPSTCTTANAPMLPVSNTATVSITLDPTLTNLTDITLPEGGSTQEPFGLTGSTPFTHAISTSNAAVLPPTNLTVASPACGTDATHLTCTLAVAARSTAGTSQVTLSTTDTYQDTVTKSFTVTVIGPPAITSPGAVTVTAPAAGNETFTIVSGSGTLTTTASSSNKTLLPDGNIAGTSSCTAVGSCSLTLTPAAYQTGSTTVTVTVSDAFGQSTGGSFVFTVNPPSAPTESGFTNLTLKAGQSGNESFTDTGTGALTVTAVSSNTTVLPNGDITGASACTAAGNCTITVNPPTGQSGTTTVTVTVADGYGQSSTGTFGVTVKASANGGGNTGGSGGGGGGASTPLGLLALAGLLGLAGLRQRTLRRIG